ncbi:hypothetical protein Q7A53_15830 [Halobacillus rhizosphaerae]|uniref:hypothetical protein n=1 Tax=Halobacillus rhizosphaerae TaxID=3064889 RepID=UPI00398A6B92
MHEWGFFPPFGFFFFLLFLGFFITNIIMWRRRRWGCSYGPDQRGGRAILERRLASGEIDVDEYKRLKAVFEED